MNEYDIFVGFFKRTYIDIDWYTRTEESHEIYKYWNDPDAEESEILTPEQKLEKAMAYFKQSEYEHHGIGREEQSKKLIAVLADCKQAFGNIDEIC